MLEKKYSVSMRMLPGAQNQLDKSTADCDMIGVQIFWKLIEAARKKLETATQQTGRPLLIKKNWQLKPQGRPQHAIYDTQYKCAIQ